MVGLLATDQIDVVGARAFSVEVLQVKQANHKRWVLQFVRFHCALFASKSLVYQPHPPVHTIPAASQFYSEYTTVYQPANMDVSMLAVPRKAGSMENWGLIMFDEERFLLQPITASSRDIYRTISVVCHEIGHQWFGNLVGPQTLPDVAWTEGLTTHLEYKCIDELS